MLTYQRMFPWSDQKIAELESRATELSDILLNATDMVCSDNGAFVRLLERATNSTTTPK